MGVKAASARSAVQGSHAGCRSAGPNDQGPAAGLGHRAPWTKRSARPAACASTRWTAMCMLNRLPGVFCAGEMLDWEAPTGGYLLTACHRQQPRGGARRAALARRAGLAGHRPFPCVGTAFHGRIPCTPFPAHCIPAFFAGQASLHALRPTPYALRPPRSALHPPHPCSPASLQALHPRIPHITMPPTAHCASRHHFRRPLHEGQHQQHRSGVEQGMHQYRCPDPPARPHPAQYQPGQPLRQHQQRHKSQGRMV